MSAQTWDRSKAARRILAKRRKARTPREIDFLSRAFPQQIAFIRDPDPFKIGHCPRGAAKSYTAGLGMYDVMQDFPGCSIFYVTKTHDMARNIMWRTVMKQINDDFKVGMVFNEGLLEGRHPNGSTFRLTGIDSNVKQQDKLLGGKYKLIVLDEVAFFDTDLTTIIYRTLIPAAARVGGSIWMMSTSSDLTRGLFYEATRPEPELRTPGWSVHEWCWRDNPYVRDDMQAMLDKLIAANPRIVETNHYKQMWDNKWTVDESKLVYKFNKDRNLYTELPKLPADGWSYVLGIDFGWEDDNAFVLTGYHVNHPILYVIKTLKKPQMTFDEIIEVTRTFMADPVYAPHKIFVDVSAKQGVESMRQRSGIPFEYADKLGKVEFIEQMNGDLVLGNVKMHTLHESLRLELSTLVWIAEGDKIKYPKREHPGLPNHLCDAFLYAWRNGYHYHHAPLVKLPPVGSKAWYDAQAEGIWERERARLESEQPRGDWPEEPMFAAH